MQKYFMNSTHTLKFRAEHFAWLLLYFNLLILFPRSGQTVTSIDPQSTFRILMVIIASALAVLSLSRNTNTIRLFVKLPLLAFVIYAIVALFSSTYASVPLYSMWKGLEIVVGVLVIAVIMGNNNQYASCNKAYNLTLLLIGLTAATAWIGMLVNPSFAFTYEKGLLPFRIQGYYPLLNSNSLGTFSAISALIAVIRLLQGTKNKGIYIIIAVAMSVTMILTTSRTALIAFLLGLLAFSFFGKRKMLFYSLIGVITLVFIGGVVQDFATDWMRKGQADSTLESLSGRTRGWEAAWKLFEKSPLGGHGIASAGRFDVLQDGKASTLHGSFFDVIVGVGIAGTVPWAMGLLFTGYRLLRPAKIQLSKLPLEILNRRSEALALYTFLMVRGFTSSGLAMHEKEFMLFLTLMAFATTNFGVKHQTFENNTNKEDRPNDTEKNHGNILRHRSKYKSLN